MAGLLDYIFSTLDIQGLDKKKVIQYLAYLQEIFPQIHTYEEKIKFFSYRVQLTERLIVLDCIALRELNRVLAEERKAVALKKAKYYLVKQD